jgi:hypothetical protein
MKRSLQDIVRSIVLIVATAPAALAQDVAPPFFPELRLEALGATRESPLFSPTRRPPEPKPEPARPAPVAALAVPVAAPPPPPPDLRLIGLVLAPERQVAIVEHGLTGETLRLAPGAHLDAWKMSIVDGRTIAFEHEGRRESYALFER